MSKVFMFLIMGIALFAHSQTPITYGGKKNKFDSISLSQIKIVPITIQNLNTFKQKYSISINNKVVGKTSFLLKNEKKIIQIPIKIDEANKLKFYKICTTSIPNKKEMFNTRICTKTYLYWAKENEK